jgi:hypothetical protein
MIGQDRKQPTHTGTIWDLLKKNAATINLWHSDHCGVLPGNRNEGGGGMDTFSSFHQREGGTLVVVVGFQLQISTELGDTSCGWSCQDQNI